MEEEEEEEDEEQTAVASVSPAASLASLYTSEKFYSDAESDDDYKDPLPDFYPQSKSYHSVSFIMFSFIKLWRLNCRWFEQTMNKSSNGESGEQLHITMAIQRLQADLQSINSRLEALELHRKETTSNGSLTDAGRKSKHSTVEQVGSFAVTYGSLPSVNRLSLPSWFPFKNVNLATIMVILGWPLVAQYLFVRLHQRRNLPGV